VNESARDVDDQSEYPESDENETNNSEHRVI
jgi:hypothetical protein